MDRADKKKDQATFSSERDTVTWTEEAKARLNLALFGKSDKPLAWVQADGKLLYCREDAAPGQTVYALHAAPTGKGPCVPPSTGDSRYPCPNGRGGCIDTIACERSGKCEREVPPTIAPSDDEISQTLYAYEGALSEQDDDQDGLTTARNNLISLMRRLRQCAKPSTVEERTKIRDEALEDAAQIALRRTEIPKDARKPTRDYVVVLGEEIASLIRERKSVSAIEAKGTDRAERKDPT